MQKLNTLSNSESSSSARARFLQQSAYRPKARELSQRRDSVARNLRKRCISLFPSSPRARMSKPLTFVTGNANKLKEVQRILSTSSANAFSLNSRDLDLPEIQGSTREVASAKCRAAAEAIGGPCMTEVRRLFRGMRMEVEIWTVDRIRRCASKLWVDYQDLTSSISSKN